MRVAGTREDGALWLTLASGMSVILREDRCSPPTDTLVCERLGPWHDAHGVSGGDRRELQRRLDAARPMPVHLFELENRKVKVHAQQGKKKYKFEYAVSGPDEKVIGDEPVDEPALDKEQAEEGEETGAKEAVVAPEQAAPAGAPPNAFPPPKPKDDDKKVEKTVAMRRDGAFSLTTGDTGRIVRDNRVSPAVVVTELEALGPWIRIDDTATQAHVETLVEQAYPAPLTSFVLSKD